MFALSSVLLPPRALAEHSHSPLTNIFSPESTPAKSIFDLSIFVLSITGIIFVVVFTLLVYSIFKFRANSANADREPAQVYGSNQIEMAWTIIPILIVVVLFLATARVIHAIQDAPEPAGAVEVTTIGHQYWWEFRYPKLGIVAANELHVPVSDPSHPTPTFLQLLSADTDHSFWIPELAGKTDLVPNHPNRMWMDPHRTGIFLGQCAQYCGAQHAKMLLRVSVDSPQDFAAWVRGQQQLAVQDAIVTANELHIPVSGPDHPTPTFLQLLSADTDHSFWVPELAGKTDLIPNHPNRMWMDPQSTGVFVGQCAQYCGTQHAKMLLRVSVDGPEDFASWVRGQQKPAVEDAAAIAGRRVFERNACMNCHAVGGTSADGRFGPDLTHLMSRATIAAGAAENTHDNLRLWIQNPSAIKPGSLMPAMKLSDADLNAVVSYMETLH